MSNSPDSNHIVYFFLDLYRRQVGLPEPDPRLMSARALSISKNSGEVTYELKVTRGGRDHTRRMSLCRLGGDAESRSICYKVIYDDLLVLKIPPEPLTDFDHYLEKIDLERVTASRLSPEVPCVSPSITAILKKDPEFRNERNGSHETHETDVISRLKDSPSFQRYLKIRGTFVFFMSLSKYLFFDQMIGKIHQTETLLSNAIADSLHMMEDITAFQTAFGEGKGTLFFSFANLQQEYLQAMDRLLQQHGHDSYHIPDYGKKQWMFHQLAGKPISGERYALPKSFFLDQQMAAKRIFSEKKKTIKAFIDLIKSDIEKTSENRNRNTVEGIIGNLLSLLFNLKEKRTAIRDLKPDNMFLAGDSDNPDIFLTSADQYKLGLIDLETSANFEEISSMQQPILAGTPSFATPSHIFENHILEQVFHDATRILYLQDWFAAIGIIFNVATGKVLFEKTGKLLAEVVRVRLKAVKNGEPLQEVLKNASWVFWHTACSEFSAVMASNREIFKNISLSLGEMERGMLLEEALTCERLLADQMNRSISNQRFFKKEEALKGLRAASPERIAAIQENWKTGENFKKAPAAVSAGVVRFLRGMEHIKKCSRELSEVKSILQEKGADMSAQDIIFLLFRLVFFSMYRPEWNDRKPPGLY
jgi:hypothetical protein